MNDTNELDIRPVVDIHASDSNHNSPAPNANVPLFASEPTSRISLLVERNHHLYVRKTSQRYGRTYVGREFDFIDWLIRAEKLVDSISCSERQPVVRTTGSKGQQLFRFTTIGAALVNVCKTYREEVAAYYKHHRFNPPLTVMLEIMDQWSHELLEIAGFDNKPVPSNARTREILQKAVAAIRFQCRTKQYRAQVNNYKRNQEKNIASCCKYMAAQFERRAQLLVMRLDLYFRPQFKGWGYTDDADLHYSKFLRALSENRIVPDVLGYISKREDGIDRGIHFHVLIVLDGHKHRDAANLTRIAGEEWVRRCGYGEYSDGVQVFEEEGKHKASYFNCYTRKDHYEFNCLGVIHPTDADMLRGLRKAIEYMCKETSQLKPSRPKGESADKSADRNRTRNLRKGIMPKGHSGRGAPRSSGLDTSVIDRELLKKR